MIFSLNEAPNVHEFIADVCIVGSGAAGISLALELAASGRSIMVLESGGLAPNEITDALNAGENVGNIPLGLMETRTRAIGGATRLWYGQCITLDPIDYLSRPWVPHSGWPIQREELERYYRKAERFFRIPENAYNECIYDYFKLTPPAFSKSSFEFKPTIYTSIVDFYKNFQADLASAKNIQVICDATATRIKLNPARSSVEAIEVKNLNGAQVIARAKIYVIACGGIENARLLLASDVGNEHGMVGRFLQDHITGFVAELQSENPRPLQDIFGLLYRKNLRYFPKFHLSETAQRQHQVLNGTMHLRFEYGSSSIEGIRKFVLALRRGRLPKNATQEGLRILSDLPLALRVAYRRYARGLSPDIKPKKTLFQVHIEQAPNSSSRVMLSNEQDALGQQRAKVDWRIGDLEQHTIQVMCKLLEEEVTRLRLGNFEMHSWVHEHDWTIHVKDTSHPTGTTRMADTPLNGVVDKNCQVFGVKGLYVAGSSVFPTTGYANPTLTIVALSLRLCEHLRTQ